KQQIKNLPQRSQRQRRLLLLKKLQRSSKYTDNKYIQKLAQGNKRVGKMTLTVDAARAAFNSSTTTVSVKRLAALLTTLL
ncbi:MAG: hypothetical protein IKR64_04965, partial [Treponema sp.]|nr:hypothetical protein [Treponema sp.]